MTTLEEIQEQMNELIHEWITKDYLKKGHLFVVGCSTSEVIGQKIGTAGSNQVGQVIFTALQKLSEEHGIHLAYQCCEHLNRALVVERNTMKEYGLEEVSAVPIAEAGGSMATFAYHHFEQAVLVETIQADAGIDIGDTFIGMHLKRVAVPVRFSIDYIGNARLTAAITRPKLIGGARAVYA